MKNQGKIFEKSFKSSVPDYALLYRLPDSAQSFGGNSKLRFSRKNPFDYILWDSKHHILYALELKTVGGKSISFERTEKDAAEIHYHQVQGLNLWNKYDGVVCGFIIEFRDLDKCIFVSISDYNSLINIITKKSFNMNDLEQNNIPYFVIDRKLRKTQYSYDIDSFLERKRL